MLTLICSVLLRWLVRSGCVGKAVTPRRIGHYAPNDPPRRPFKLRMTLHTLPSEVDPSNEKAYRHSATALMNLGKQQVAAAMEKQTTNK